MIDKAQLAELARAQEEGLDIVSRGVQDLYGILDHLTSCLRTSDCMISALKYSLIKKEILTEEEIDTLADKIAKKFNAKLDEAILDTKKPVALSMEGELELLHKAAKEAAANPYDEQAFIFGS